MISEKELDHLASLCKLKLTEEEKVKYLWNMDSIINFLNQLKNFWNVAWDQTSMLMCFDEWEKYEDPKSLLENSIHRKWDFVSIKTSLSQK